MNKQYINIGIAGLSIHDSDQLKHQLYAIFPHHFNLQWKNAADINLDCLFIHERFFETEGIQRILTRRALPWLKISKDKLQSGRVRNNTLYLPIDDTQDLNKWVDENLVNHSEQELFEQIEEQELDNLENANFIKFDEDFFKNMFLEGQQEKLHLFDDQGTLAVIDVTQNIAWLNKNRSITYTNESFLYESASINHLTIVSRKDPVILQDWLWNLFWGTKYFSQTIPEDGHFRILSWPKPHSHLEHKQIFQLSACFIQGAKMSKIAEQCNIPLDVIRQFIAANTATQNIKKINIWDTHYNPPELITSVQEKNFVQSFFSKIRRKFGF
ncbi:hypothetical protein B9T33_13885 [Acinetobacter sp. ANC 5054]|uniref:hypothetical protein n=1 Tax=Acinetobacter sp. ANC 5054 TaxID=1977877 RepID=UPI000A347FDF|nr:hypothetical protein [Acinetobacter sp. ANC 5054]OTG79050.1 hypothetical protein B9T33_13885 [Acinetobacter sp. ANC 5054]